MKFVLLTLILFAAGVRAEDKSPAGAGQGQMSFCSTAPAEWPSKENFTADKRGDAVDLVNAILDEQRLPAAAPAK